MSTYLVHDMSSLLGTLSTGVYEVRPGVAPVSDGHGRFTPGTPAASVFQPMSVQALDGKSALKLPEGERSEDWRTVFAAYPLRPAEVGSGRAADCVVIDGEPFEVMAVQPWESAANMCQARVKRQRR